MLRVPAPVKRRYAEAVDFIGRCNTPPGWDGELLQLLAEILHADAIALLHTDPDTFLAIDGRVRGFGERAAVLFFQRIYLQRERVSFLDLRAQGVVTSLLSEYTSGRPESELRYVEVYRPAHLQHELRACLVSGRGYWGALCMARGDDAPDFGRWERWLLERLAPRLASALRARRLVDHVSATDAQESAAAAVVMVDRSRGRVLFQTESAPAVLEDLCGSASVLRDGGPLPLALQSLVASSAAVHDPTADHDLTLRGRSGRWWTASVLAGSQVGEPARQTHGAEDAVAVLLVPSRSGSVLHAMTRIYELTEREAEVLDLVAYGLTTAEIASRLFVAPYTVQDHLKNIFAKVGVRSRRALMARIFHLESPLGRTLAPERTE